MSEIKVAARYAKSLIDLSIEQNALEETKKDMLFFRDTLKKNTELIAILNNPIIPLRKKDAILEAIFNGKVSKTTSAFFKIMVNKGRSELLYGTAKEFNNEYNIKKGIFHAKVVSAAPLTEESRKQILDIIIENTGGEVILKEVVDDKLIGGFVLTVGDKQVDTSIANTLNKLKKQFDQKVVA